jgi:hypothetical protein
MKKYVYVIYDPLYEKVLCVHDEMNMECDTCKPIRKKRNIYYLECEKRLIKTKK